MRRYTNIWMSLFSLALAIYWLSRSADVRMATEASLSLCLGSLLPALFPFFVMTSFLISLGFPAALGALLRKPMERLFCVSGNSSGALLLGLLGGYPSGARTAAELYRNGDLSREEAEHLLLFTNNCGPAFLVSYAGGEILGNVRLGIWLWLIHILAAWTVGFLCRGKSFPSRRVLSRNSGIHPAEAFINAVSAGFSAYLTVCSFVLLSSVLSAPLTKLPAPWSMLTGFLELSGGIASLPPTPFGFVAISVFAGFGGLAVHLQSFAFIVSAELSPKKHFFGKILQALFAGLYAFLFSFLLF